MSETEIQLGVQDQRPIFPKFDPGVVITIRGDHVLSTEVIRYLEKFESQAGSIEVK